MIPGGPDDAGLYLDLNGHLGLGHRRLSILDLSSLGHQPMQTDRYVICYNGEVYNHASIRKDLEALGYTFRSTSDTEVILAAFTQWGEACASRFRGMFAFAIWDKTTHVLKLCRDRVGVKPLYWFFKDGVFLFGSELKSLGANPHFEKTINLGAISGYLKTGYIADPLTIYQHCHKLTPGSWLSLSPLGDLEIHPYWSVESIYQNAQPLKMDYPDILDHTESLLKESFSLRMVSDVPVGVFLSSGVDSSLVAALLSQTHALKTFTIGFGDPAYSEAPDAAKIARHLGTDHTEAMCTQQDFMEIIQLLPQMYDEPFGDSSAIPTHLVSRIAKSKVSVALSADGGDELFGGYVKYEAAHRFSTQLAKIPYPIREMIGRGLLSMDPERIESLSRLIPGNRFANLKDKVVKFGRAIQARSPEAFFLLSGQYLSDKQLSHLFTGPHYQERLPGIDRDPSRDFGFFGLWDIQTYLSGDILTKVDRASMAVSLEGREPFLDHTLIEWAMLLPDWAKYQPGTTKRVLRDVLSRHLPLTLLSSQKKGFGIPVYDWLRGPLKPQLLAMAHDPDFAETFCLSQETLKQWVHDFLDHKNQVSAHSFWFLFQLWQWKTTWLAD